MGELLDNVLPVALGAAVSPTMLTVTLLILGGENHPRARGAAYTIGGAAVLLAIGIAGLFLFNHTVATSRAHASTGSAVVSLVIGVLLVLLAVRLHRRPPRKHKQRANEPAGREQSARLARYLGLGVAGMAVNFTTVALYVQGTKEIARADVTDSDKVLALAVMLVIAMAAALVPLLISVVAPQRAARILTPIRGFAQRHGRTIGIAMAAAFGVYLIVKGILAL